MSDNYQAVYDAVRSRIGPVDSHDAVASALREAFGNADHQIRCALQEVTGYLTDPSVMYRPALSVDGNQWCVLYGKDLQNGVAGFGDSPAGAMQDFNKQWHAAINAKGRAIESQRGDVSGTATSENVPFTKPAESTHINAKGAAS